MKRSPVLVAVTVTVLTALTALAAGACTGGPPPPPGTSPVGSWRVTGYMNAGDRLSAPLPGTTITLVIGADGRLSGRACNSYGASYSLDGSAITISDVFSTKMYCTSPEGVMQQESDYFTALQAATTWRVEGGTLTLAHPRGPAVVAQRAGPA